MRIQDTRTVNWGNSLTRGLEFLSAPGTLFDATGKARRSADFRPSSTSFRRGASISGTGAVGTQGSIVADGPLFGGLSASTILGIARHQTTVNLDNNGNAIYSERGSTGNAIYKIGITLNAGNRQAEFVYRNDGATLLSLRNAYIDANMTDGQWIFVGGRKNGTAHDCFYEGRVTAGTFGSGSTAFTEATISRTIAWDKGDTAGNWRGEIAFVAGWSRALSDAEVFEIRRSPWQLFQPAQAIRRALPITFRPAWARGSNSVVGVGAVL